MRRAPTSGNYFTALRSCRAVGSHTISYHCHDQDYVDFAAQFEPLAEDSEEAKALRKRGFRLADPNGNGLCSLAEIETFVLQTLMSKFPKDPKKTDALGQPLERGRDLFTAFRCEPRLRRCHARRSSK